MENNSPTTATPVNPAPQAVQAAVQPTAIHRFEFTGKGDEYFKIWIVNILLSIITVGIYSAWAKVRTQRYFYGNTFLDGANFEYHAKPIAILKGRIIAIIALLIYITLSNFFPVAGIGLAIVLAIVAPWVIWRSLQFNAWMTSHRNVRFNFRGDLKSAYKYFFLIPVGPLLIAGLISLFMWATMGSASWPLMGSVFVLAFIATYFLYPWFQKLFTQFYMNNHRYGQGKFHVELETSEYYIIYLLTIALSLLAGLIAVIGVMVIGGIFAAIASVFGAMPDLGNIDQLPSDESLPGLAQFGIIGGVILIYLPFIAVSVWIKAYLKTKLRNYAYSSASLDKVIRFVSEMNYHRLFWIYLSNTLLIIFTLGLAYPWAKVRLARYSAETMQAQVFGNLNGFITQQQEAQSALGEELGDAFDVEVGMGLSL
ncbi:MAG: YjgN family protein [Thiolinea sp.]